MDSVQYVGDPGEYPDINANWFNLTHSTKLCRLRHAREWLLIMFARDSGRYIAISKEEAEDAFGREADMYYDPKRGHYIAGYV